MSTLDPQFGLPEAPIATRITTDDPDQFGVPALQRATPGLASLEPVWAGWFKKLRTWLYRPNSFAYQGAANQTLTTAASAALSFDTNLYDTGSIHSTTANLTRFVAPVKGIYLASAQLQVASNAAGPLYIFIKINGGFPIVPNLQSGIDQTAGTIITLQFSSPVPLNAGDYVEFWAQQQVAVTTTTTLNNTWGALTLLLQP